MKKLVGLFLYFLSFATVDAQISMHSYVDNSGRDIVLTWDEETGKSIFYAWNTSINNWKAYEINLPEEPISGSKGNIMMHSYVDNSDRDVVLVWDTETGQSVFYAWNTSINNWKAYEINLPQEPIEAKGTIGMHPYVDNSGRDVVLVWDTETGQSAFYAWNTSAHNWKAYEINLPKEPIEAEGTTMMVPYIDNSGRDVVLVWDTETGTSTFYAWNTSAHNWKAYEINLPEYPINYPEGATMMVPYIDNSGRDVVLAWDTETGTSTFYAWNTSAHNWKAYEINLPEYPINYPEGATMMVPYIDNSGRDVVLVWDTETGTSTFYAWNTSAHNWKAYEINLPERPLDE